MKLTASVGLAALCAALWGTAGATSAQTYSRVVAFGDSLTDNGNIPVLGGPAPYPSGRFSNGPVFVEDLQSLGVTSLGHIGQTTGSVDWAVGGAETGSLNNISPALPGMAQEVGGYFLGGGTVGAHDMVVLWGGANDLFANFAAAGASANPTGYIGAVATTAAGNISAYANQFAAAGAGTIVIPNMPPLASTPAFAGGPAAPLALSAANSFNAALLAGIKADAVAHPNTNFILLDANTTLLSIIGNPAAFGFSNVTAACVATPSCATGSLAAQNGYVFWDGVHPTAAAHALLGAILVDYVTYGDRGAAMGIETEAGLRHRSQSSDTALDRLQGRDFAGDRTGVGASLEYDSAHIDARALADATTDASETLRINLDWVASPSLKLGGLFSFANSDVNAGRLEFHDQSASADALIGWRSGKLFFNADAGVGLEDVARIRRQTAVPGLQNTGSTSGWSAGVKAQAGAWFDLANRWTVSPRAALDYAHGSIDGYTETGPFDRYQYAENKIDAASLEGSVRLQGPVGGAVWAHLEGGYRGYLSYDAGPVRTTLADNVAQTLSRTLQRPDDGLALVDAGLSGSLFGQVKWDVSYRGRFGARYDDNLAHAGLNLAF